MRTHIDRIRDSGVNSQKRICGWLWNRFGEYLDELKEDANQESVKKSLTSPAVKPKPDAKQPTPALPTSPAVTEPKAKAAAAPPSKASPKPPPKNPKGGDGKATGKGKGDNAKGKGGKEQGTPKDSNPKSKQSSMHLFPTGDLPQG